MRAARKITVAALLLALCPVAASAQQPAAPDTLEGTLPEVKIEAARATETAATAPFAVSIQTRSPDEIALEPALSLDAVLQEVPGVWINDRGHFALGERITVRGLGWRAAFGVRGVQVVLDGIPLTLPDGQTYAEIVEPSLIRSAELIRGPSSRFWGNGSGGVLFLSTDRPTDEASLRTRALAGSYGQRQLLAQGGTPIGNHYVQGYASNVSQDGYRQHSEGRRTRAGLHGTFDLGERTRLRAIAAFVNQDAENPSSLTRKQLEQNPELARPLFVEENAGKQSTQVQGGLTLDHQTSVGVLSATAYGLVRDLANPLPFGRITYVRRSGGARLTFQRQQGRFQWGAGLDAALQSDDRVERAPDTSLRQIDQMENVLDAAASGYVRFELTSRLQLSGGLRASRIRFEADDQLLVVEADSSSLGDQSGERLFTAWSPSVGLSYRVGSALLFANYSTAFETPTTTELVNRPDASGGFNEGLDPQKTHGVEIGARGGWARARLWFDVALFRLNVQNTIVQTGTNPRGLEFFGNASESLHQGVEATATWQPLPYAQLRLSYTGSRFTFQSEDLDGNRIPGIPDHRFHASLQSTRGGLWGRLATEAASDYFVNDKNTAESEGYVVVDAKVGYRKLTLAGARIQPFFAINNLFDAQYNSSFIANAFGGRYYEPAPGRNIAAGVNLTL